MEEAVLSTPDTNLETKLLAYNSSNEIIFEEQDELSSIIAGRRFEILERMKNNFHDLQTARPFTFEHEDIGYMILDFLFDEEVKPYGSKLTLHVKVKKINDNEDQHQ